MDFRPYQKLAIDELRRKYSKGIKKVLLVMPTGTGKTFVFSSILKMIDQKGKHAIMVVRGKKLVDQASKSLFKLQVRHGCLQAGHWNKNPKARIQVCSIDTLYRRKIIPKADLIIIDEAHLARSNSFDWLLGHYPDAFFLPVTATPNVPKGLSKIAEDFIEPITFNDAVAQGYLVGPKYFSPTTIDLSKVKTNSSGDYDEKELETVMDQKAIYGDIIETWKKLGNNEPSLCFCVNVEHSIKMNEQFNEAGIASAHIDANTPDNVRNEYIEKLETGELKIITNIGTLTTGVDIPCLKNIIFARPTKTYNLYIQMLGRGTRLYKNKEFFRVFDHANNVTQNGFMEVEHEINLDGKTKKKKSPQKRIKICEECFFAYDPFEHGFTCPDCGFQIPKKEQQELQEKEAELLEIEVDIEILNFIKQLKKTRKEKNYKRGWVYFQMVSKYGEDIAQKYIPKRKVPEWVNRKT